MRISDLKLKLYAIADRRLYGRDFFFPSAWFIAFSAFIESIFFLFYAKQLLIVYILLLVFVVLLSAILTKNSLTEFYAISFWLAFLFYFTSIFAVVFTIVNRFENTVIGISQLVLIFFVSNIALTISIVHIVVLGQRASLRESIGLKDEFFSEQKRIWKSKLEFSNSNDIIELLDEGNFVLGLFDKGCFNLAVLWSCNVMEKVVDAMIDEIIRMDPEKKGLFKRTDGTRQPYPKKLENLGFKYSENETNRRPLNVDTLWHKLRDPIAHHNKKPTFDETYAALRIFVSFIQDLPTLQV